MQDTEKIRSSVNLELKSKKLMRATLAASLGIFPLIWAGIFLEPAVLQYWGMPLFALAIILTGYGFYPYSHLVGLEKNPSVLVCSKKQVTLMNSNHVLVEIPWETIEEISYVDGDPYGIGILLKHPVKEKIKVYTKKEKHFFYNQFGFDLFFPYFSRKGMLELNEIYAGSISVYSHASPTSLTE